MSASQSARRREAAGWLAYRGLAYRGAARSCAALASGCGRVVPSGLCSHCRFVSLRGGTTKQSRTSTSRGFLYGRRNTVFGDKDDDFQKLIVPLPTQTKHVKIMTALELNAELYRQLSIIAEDESLMTKMLKYAKKLAAKKEVMDETEYLMSSPAMAEIIRQGQEDIKNGRGEVVKVEDLWK